MAITSLVLGCIGFVFCAGLGVGSIVGLIMGIVATVRANRYPSLYGGKGLAIAGIATNAVCLLLVVPIVGAIAIPNLLLSRMAANEAYAQTTLFQICQAETRYEQLKGGSHEFGSLSDLSDAGLIGSDVREKFGYRFDVTPRDVNKGRTIQYDFDAVATPMVYGSTGRRSFYVNADNVIHAADKAGAEATQSDPALYRSYQPRQ